MIGFKKSLNCKEPRKSGMLKRKVINTTPLNTVGDANLLETTFSKINTMVIG